MDHVYIVFGTYNDCDDQDTLGVYTTFEAAEARVKSVKEEKTSDGWERCAYAYIYKAKLDTVIEF